jgi:hypothetical protein
MDSGSGKQDQNPGWVKSQDPDPGWKTRIIFLRAEKPFFWLKYLNSLMRIRDPGSGMEKNQFRDQGSRMEKFVSRIRDLGLKKFEFGIRDLE